MTSIINALPNNEPDSGYESDEHYIPSDQDTEFRCKMCIDTGISVNTHPYCPECTYLIYYLHKSIEEFTVKDADVYLKPVTCYPRGLDQISPIDSDQLFAFFLPNGLCTTMNSIGDLYLSIGIKERRRLFRVVKRDVNITSEEATYLDEDYIDISSVKNRGGSCQIVSFEGFNLQNGNFMDCPFQLTIENCYSATELSEEKGCLILKASMSK